MMLQRVRLLQEKGEFLVQVLQAQQGANALVEGVFIYDQNGIPIIDVCWQQVCDSERCAGKLQMADALFLPVLLRQLLIQRMQTIYLRQ